jgi:hypothetical protein
VLEPQKRFDIADVPGIWCFPDDRDGAGFYALAAAPRVARGPGGEPQLGLSVYGRRDGDSFVPDGGVLTLTTSLELQGDEAALVAAALSRRLAAAAAEPDAAAPPPPAHLLAADVVEAEVEVRLADGVELHGSATTAGAFRSSFNEKLDAEQAASLAAAWARGLPDAASSYRLRLRPTGGSSSLAVASTDWVAQAGTEQTGGSAAAFRVAAEPPAESTLTLEGPLAASGDELDAAINRVEL